jgi:hypothetical protein
VVLSKFNNAGVVTRDRRIGRFFKILGQSELCHNHFTIVKRPSLELWRSSDWPKNFKEPALGADFSFIYSAEFRPPPLILRFIRGKQFQEIYTVCKVSIKFSRKLPTYMYAGFKNSVTVQS